MTGHEPILAMRRARRKPAFVTVSDRPCHTDWAKWGDQPVVCVAGDTPELLDLRFLVGLNVMIAGLNGDRVRQLFAACIEAGAARALAFEQRLNVERDCIESVAVHDSLATVEAA